MSSDVFQCVHVIVPHVDADLVERVAAEAWSAGAAGVEERSEADSTRLLIYAQASEQESIAEAVRSTPGVPGVAIENVEEVDVSTDWSEEWKRELRAIVISPRLVVRPSFVPSPNPAAISLVVDPGQAFGTGGHASTRLALECIDALATEFTPSTRVLDVGVGSGVLALAALAFGAGRAVGHDLDALAAPEARRTAEGNQLEPLDLFTGPLEALEPQQFDFVLANLLRSEMLPIAQSIAQALKPRGKVVLSGLLDSDLDAVCRAFEPHGLGKTGARFSSEASGETWGALILAR